MIDRLGHQLVERQNFRAVAVNRDHAALAQLRQRSARQVPVCQSDPSQLVGGHRHPRGSQQAQRPQCWPIQLGEPSVDDLPDRVGQPDARLVPSRLDELRRHQRVAARTLCHRGHERKCGPLAGHSLDERQQLIRKHALQGDLLHVRTAKELVAQCGGTMAPPDLVAVERDDQRQCHPPAQSQEHADQLARAGIRVLEVLDDQAQRAVRGLGFEQSQQALADARPALVGRVQ